MAKLIKLGFPFNSLNWRLEIFGRLKLWTLRLFALSTMAAQSKISKSTTMATLLPSRVEARKANNIMVFYHLAQMFAKPQFITCGIPGHTRGTLRLYSGITGDECVKIGYWYQLCRNPEGHMTCYRRHREPTLEELHANDELRLALTRRQLLKPNKRNQATDSNGQECDEDDGSLHQNGQPSGSASSGLNTSTGGLNSSVGLNSSTGLNTTPSHSQTSSSGSSGSPTSLIHSQTTCSQASNTSGGGSQASSLDRHGTDSFITESSISYSPNSSFTPPSQSQGRKSGTGSTSLWSRDSFSSTLPSYPSSQPSLGDSPSTRGRQAHRSETKKRSLSSLQDSSQESLTTRFNIPKRRALETPPDNSPVADRPAPPAPRKERRLRKRAPAPHPNNIIDLCSPSPELKPRMLHTAASPINLVSPSPPPPCSSQRSLTASGSHPPGRSLVRYSSPERKGVVIDLVIFFSRVSYHETKIYYFTEPCDFQMSDQRGAFRAFGYTEDMSFEIFQPAEGGEGGIWREISWNAIIPVKNGDRIVLKLAGLEVDQADAVLMAKV